jgi:DHA2 family multidrug resistance protein
MMRADLRIGFAYVMWAYIWRGLGLGFLYPPVYAVAIRGIPLERTRAASSLLNLQVTLGGAFSVALLSTLIEARQTVYQARFADTQELTSVGTQQALALFTRLAGALGTHAASVQSHALSLLQEVIHREALAHALRDGFYMIVLVGLGSLVLILTMWPVRPR